MSKDWTTDVEKFVPDADAGAIDGIVRYCGIALASPDSSLVAYRGEEEVGRVRENLLKKKLGITRSDAELDKASSTVGDKMKVHHDNNRVTAYYLLADHFGKLSTFK